MTNNHYLTNHVIYYHFCISDQSPLIPKDSHNNIGTPSITAPPYSGFIHPSINLTLEQHTIMEIDTMIATMHNDTSVHIHHPALPLIIKHLMWLRQCMMDNRHLKNHVIYHHVRISAQSTPISKDRSLYITVNNSIYTLTPSRTDTTLVTTHTLQLFLIPHKKLSHLEYTYVGEINNQRNVSLQFFIINTNLPSKRSTSKRRLLIRTTSYTPDLGRIITFLADPTQQQMSILTLVTHILLLMPGIKVPHVSWNKVRVTTVHP